MRIANLLVGRGSSAYPSQQVPSSLIPPGVQVEPIETGVYLEPRTPAARTLGSTAFVAAALRAEEDGFDAAFINTTVDYGLAETRSIARIPVTGSGESALRLAAGLGERFAIVQVWPAWSRWIDHRNLGETGLAGRCCAIRNVALDGEEDAVHAGMLAGEAGPREAMLRRISAEIDAAVREDGADVVVLGCTCMAGVWPTLAERAGVPVVDPLRAGYLAAEKLGRLGLSAGPRDGAPAREQLRPLYDAVAAAVAGSGMAEGNEIDGCEVCAPVHAEEVDSGRGAIA